MLILRVFMQGGPMMLPLVLISFVLLGIVARIMWHLFVRGHHDCAGVQNGLDGLLFWGGFAVVIGVLGSAIGYHKAMTAVAALGIVNPRIVWIGTAEGLVSSIAGLLVFAVSGTFWFGLRSCHLKTPNLRRQEARAESH